MILYQTSQFILRVRLVELLAIVKQKNKKKKKKEKPSEVERKKEEEKKREKVEIFLQIVPHVINPQSGLAPVASLYSEMK